jgi:hypothetical protein
MDNKSLEDLNLGLCNPLLCNHYREEEMKILFDDLFWDGQLLRALGCVYYGGADIGECITTAQRITQKVGKITLVMV